MGPMTHDPQDHTIDGDEAGIEGFQRLKDEAAASGIEQDVPLNAAAFLSCLDLSTPAPITLAQLRELAGGVRAALDLAHKAVAESKRDEDAATVGPIVTKLKEVIDALPSVPGAPL